MKQNYFLKVKLLYHKNQFKIDKLSINEELTNDKKSIIIMSVWPDNNRNTEMKGVKRCKNVIW